MMPLADKASALFEFDEKTRSVNGSRFLFGVDEAGRGPLAGPVVAGAVWLREPGLTVRVDDSKKLSERQRERAFEDILCCGVAGVGIIDEGTIDKVNILNATYLAMAAAVEDLTSRLPQDVKVEAEGAASVRVLIDGNSFKGRIPYKFETVVAGDSKSLCVACASIIAKVTRDRMMLEYDRIYPQYGFKGHKGYPAPAHLEAIRKHGLSPIHRRSFRSGF